MEQLKTKAFNQPNWLYFSDQIRSSVDDKPVLSYTKPEEFADHGACITAEEAPVIRQKWYNLINMVSGVPKAMRRAAHPDVPSVQVTSSSQRGV